MSEALYVIHCKALAERRGAMLEALAAVGREATWIEDHDPPLDAAARARVADPRRTPAEVSLYLKHEAALKHALATGAARVLVLEDDAMLTPEVQARLEAWAPCIPDDADIVFIGAGAQRDLEPSRGANATGEEQPSFQPTTRSRTTVAHWLSADGARKTLAALERVPITLPIDHQLDRLIKGGTLKAYCSVPALVGHGTVEGRYAHSLGVGWRERTLRRRVQAKLAQLLRRVRHRL